MSVMDEITSFLDQWPDAEFGPAHIVLSDSNLSDGHIRWCVGLCKAALSHDERDLVAPHEIGTFIDTATMTTYKKPAGDKLFMDRMDWYAQVDRGELAATIVFLEHLLTIPAAERDIDDPR